MNLRHALDSFLDSAYARGLTQLNSTIKCLRGPGKPIGRDHPQVLFQKCMWAVFDVLEEGIAILDKGKEREKEREKKKGEGNKGEKPEGDNSVAGQYDAISRQETSNGEESNKGTDREREFNDRAAAREEEDFGALSGRLSVCRPNYVTP